MKIRIDDPDLLEDHDDVALGIDPAEYSNPNAYVDELRAMAQDEHGEDLSPEQVKHGEWQWAEAVRLDYKEWSGGFLPQDETDPEIDRYCEYAALGVWDRAAVRSALVAR